MVPPIFYAVVEGAKGALQRWGREMMKTTCGNTLGSNNFIHVNSSSKTSLTSQVPVQIKGAIRSSGNMPVQPRFRVKFLLKFKYENVVRLAFQKKFYSKTRMDGHITIREKSVLRGARARFQSYIPCDFGHRKPDDFSPMTHFLSCRTSQQRPHWEQKQVPIVER